ncbi:MAG: GTPase Era [Rhodospirillaceae bacterium]|jgi:GTPase|nr:GTPase Era [Rhodospirillaceae bacterium]
MTDSETRCGFVAVIGAPNAGKSTLVNKMVGAKVSIVSPKVQTTRTRVLGIALRGDSQIVFIDTPGIFTPREREKLGQAMVQAAWKSIGDGDVVALIVDSEKGLTKDTRSIIATLAEKKTPSVLVLNKIDLAPRPKLLELSAEANASGAFSETFMVSALTGDGVDDFLAYCGDHARPGPWLFPEDQITDMPMRLLAAEVVREKLFLQLHQELPYALTVETVNWEEFKDGGVKIDAEIIVDRENQKGIVLGKGGTRIKSVGAAARLELMDAFDRKVHLFLRVKVRPGWSNRAVHYRAMGLEFPI